MESLEVGGKDAALSSPQPKASVPQKSSFRAFIVKNFSTPADRQRHAAFVGGVWPCRLWRELPPCLATFAPCATTAARSKDSPEALCALSSIFAGLCATNVVTSSVFSLLASFFPQIAEERGLSPFTVVSQEALCSDLLEFNA